MITTTADSVVSSSAGVNKYGINKVIPVSRNAHIAPDDLCSLCLLQISNHIALVTSPDGTSMLAVPMSSLVAKGNVNLKPTISTVPISSAALKAKPSIITPLKILPLIASTTATTTLNVPTISKNVQTLIAPASLSIAKGMSTCSTTTHNTTGNLTIVPTAPTSAQTESSTSSALGLSVDVKDKVKSKGI